MTGRPIKRSAAAFTAQFATAPFSGEEKAIPLVEAIQRFLKPGMSLYIGRLANAATIELLRQFRDQAAGFTVIGGSRNYTSALVHKELVKKLIGNAFGELYPKPGPNYAIQRATQSGSVEIEGWSELTLIQQLMAGAMGLGFMVSRAEVEGGGLAENRGSVATIPDPFHAGRKVAALKALVPDAAIIHGWAADRFGNIIMGQPNLSDQDIWGALASGGVIATVERILPDAFVRERSCLVDIPGFWVKAVAEVPHGAHPQAMSLWGMGPVSELKSYDVDFKFITHYRNACRKTESLDAWLEEWVFGCADHGVRMKKVEETFGPIAGDESVSSWRTELASIIEHGEIFSEPCSEMEFMLVAAARKIQEIVTGKHYNLMLAGMGHGGLAAYLAYYRTREAGYPIRLAVGLGVFGYSPRPGSPHTSTLANIATAEMLTGTLTGYGVYVGGAHNRCLSILGAGQIDKRGNINSTKTASGAYLFGSGGAIDAASAQEVMVITHQSRERLVEKVGFVTCSGTPVRTLVTNEGIFEKSGEDAEFTLTSYFPSQERKTAEEAVESIRGHCGWDLKVAPSLRRVDPPDPEELALLRVFDPEGLFLKRE